jgi:hypothetical protein
MKNLFLFTTKHFLVIFLLTTFFAHAAEPTETFYIDVQEYFCHHCNKIFPTAEECLTHTKTPECPHSQTCKTCQKELNKGKEHLQKHFCLYCKRYSSDTSNNIRHQREHTGERPFNCMYCAMSFVNSTNRNKHERICRENPLRSLPTCITINQPFSLSTTDAPKETPMLKKRAFVPFVKNNNEKEGRKTSRCEEPKTPSPLPPTPNIQDLRIPRYFYPAIVILTTLQRE